MLLHLGVVIAGRKLHRSLLHNILACPMEFFDTNPLGRVLNRFSKDVDVLDVRLAMILQGVLGCLMKTLTIPVVIGYSTPWFLVSFVPLAALYITIQVCNHCDNRLYSVLPWRQKIAYCVYIS